MNHVVEFIDVSKEFKNFSIKNLNMRINRGTITGFVGANGAGKSTTMKLMMNLLKPDSGKIKIFGQDHSSAEQSIKERIGFVYDSNVFYKDLHIKSLGKIIAPAYTTWSNERFFHYIDQFDLPLNKAIKTFSKGMQMKTSLAIALSHDAEFIMMDEPTAGLDPIFRREILSILQELMNDGKRTIFFSTHITSDLERIADEITFIQDGHILFNDRIEMINKCFRLVKGDVRSLTEEIREQMISLQQKNKEFFGITNNYDLLKNELTNEMTIEEVTLEDIMFYTKGANIQYA